MLTKSLGIDDEADYLRVSDAFEYIGLEQEAKESILRILASILVMGNIEFDPVKMEFAEGSKVQKPDVLQHASTLLQIQPDVLVSCLTNKEREIRGEVTKSPLTPPTAADTRNALSKAIYSKVRGA